MKYLVRMGEAYWTGFRWSFDKSEAMEVQGFGVDPRYGPKFEPIPDGREMPGPEFWRTREVPRIQEDAARDLLAACEAFVARTDLASRWPCPDCGREAPQHPRKAIELGGGNVIGCWLCQTDDLRAIARAAIAKARPERTVP